MSRQVLDSFHPAVAAWFRETFPAGPTEPQARAWAGIRSGRNTLIAAPTGSGKTLAAFLSALDALVREAEAGPLPDEPAVLYVSPLKALGNDIERNLREPLGGIRRHLAALGAPDAAIRVLVRSGDTPAAERSAMVRRPPHVIVTTPESFYILLTSESGRRMLATVRTVILDEIHAVVADRRGAHLALSLERLEALRAAVAVGTGRPLPPLVRIGLSATQKPIEEVARFLVGARPMTDCAIVDAGSARGLDLGIELPSSPLTAVMAGEVWDELYDRLAELANAHRTTLVFVNTRRLAERVARYLGERIGEELVATHHGSLSRQQRLDAEQRLKSGALRVLVATASLELGIDIGAVELVCQLGTTRTISALLQRVGRSNHTVGGYPRGRIFPLSRDELIEAAALLASVRRGDLDRLEIPGKPLDVLAQQIVAEVAAREWKEEELFETLRRAWPYRELERAEFDAIVRLVSEGFATKAGRRVALVHRDAVNGRLRGRRGARLTAITSGGAIPDTADFQVVLEPSGTVIGSVHEDFAFESMAGDIFQLGNTSWKILRVEPGRVRVEDAHGQPPTLPFWLGEAPARSAELSEAVGRIRREVGERLGVGESSARADASATGESAGSAAEAADGAAEPSGGAAVEWLERESGIGDEVSRQIVDYLATAQAALGAIPDGRTIVLERFFDEAGGMQLVLHSPLGSRINRAWGLSLRKRFCRKFNFELQAAATEDAIVLSLGQTQSFPLEEVFRYLRSTSVRDLLVQALLDAPMFGVRWRWNTTRALAILRFRGGRKVAPQIQRMQAEDLLALVFPDQLACAENLAGEREIPDHPLVRQTIRDCLDDVMDVRGLERLLAEIERGEHRLVARDLTEPSPLAQQVLTARPYAYLDDAPLEERRTLAVRTRRWMDPKDAAELGRLDPAAIAAVRDEVAPAPRDADELHETLTVLGFLTEEEGRASAWDGFFAQLVADGRATVLRRPGFVPLWAAAEKLPHLRAVFPDAPADPPVIVPRAFETEGWTPERGVVELLRGRLEASGPVTAGALSRLSGLPEGRIEAALLALETEGFVLRGQFTPEAAGRNTEWCARRLLARIHRATLQTLRREIEPVATTDLMRFFVAWQSVAAADAPDAPEGPEALAAILAQLEGFEAPAGAWETEILPARVGGYEPSWLDALCLSGRFFWARLRPSEAEPNGRRAAPIRTTPITFVSRDREDAVLRLARAAARPHTPAPALSDPASRVRDLLASRGAAFFEEIVRRSGLLRTQVEEALAELVARGLATSDSFAGLRALLAPSPKRPPVDASRRRRGTTASLGMQNAGRWSLLPGREVDTESPATAPPPGAELREVCLGLLRRWGVVFRRLLEREETGVPWRDLLREFWRLEARGEIRGGRFVAGFQGEQFALPEAIGLLRSVRRQPAEGRLVSISAADPLNLTGILLPGPRVPTVTANRILLEDGAPVAILEAGELRFPPRPAGLPPAPAPASTSAASVPPRGDSEWRLRHALLRHRHPPGLRAWTGRPS